MSDNTTMASPRSSAVDHESSHSTDNDIELKASSTGQVGYVLSSCTKKLKTNTRKHCEADQDESHRRQQRRRRRFHRRCMELAEDAAQRCYQGNGRISGLPELPKHFVDGVTANNHHHPYGVRPYGNILTCSEGDAVRQKGLGPVMSRLNDDQVTDVLLYLDPKSLALLSRCSRFWYVSIHSAEPNLWRDATLRFYEERKRSFNVFTPYTWKDQFIWSQLQQRIHDDNKTKQSKDSNATNQNDHLNLNGDDGSINKRYHDPIVVQGIHSDVFYRSFLCRNYDLCSGTTNTDDSSPAVPPPSTTNWLDLDNIARESAESLTTERFLNEYEIPNVPVVIEGASKDWPAVKKWKDVEYLKSATTKNIEVKCDTKKDENNKTKKKLCNFRATSGTASVSAQFTMEGYFNYCQSEAAQQDEAPLYLFDRSFAIQSPQLLRDYSPYRPPYFSPTAPHGHDLFGLLDHDHPPTHQNNEEEKNEIEQDGRQTKHDDQQQQHQQRRPDFRWMICGPQRSGSAFHIDPNGTHAWNAPIVGRKRWIFYPPSAVDTPPPGVHPSRDGDTVTMPLSIGEWMISFWSQHLMRRHHPNKALRSIECTVCPGDILFVPHGWWHTVLNIDPGMSIALTQNYASSSNLANVLRFLQTRPDQISGCRDRIGEAIPPERLLDEFTTSLKRYRPDLLENATIQSRKAFTCPAWIDDDDENLEPMINKKESPSKEAAEHHRSLPSLWERAKMSSSSGPESSSITFAKMCESKTTTEQCYTEATTDNETKKEEASPFKFSFM